MEMKEIKVDEKDWFNIDEEIDPKLKVEEINTLEILRASFIHELLELYRATKKYTKKRREISKQLGISLDEVIVDFQPYYDEWRDNIEKYAKLEDN